MVKDSRRWLVPGLAVAAAAGVGWVVLRQSTPTVAPAASAAGSPRPAGAGPDDVPRIDLARLDRPRPESGIGRRDLFNFGAPPAAREAPPVASAARARPVVAETPPPPVAAPTPTPLAPLNIKYIGALEGRRGLRVAVLMTDRKEVLTGQAGEVVANRYRIVRIGLESVDVQEVGSDQVRRIPLKGN
jgi:hypothetical protein